MGSCPDDKQSDYDREQRNKLGSMVANMGIGILFVALIPNPAWGRLLFMLCALIIFSIGASLKLNADRAR